MNSIGVSRSGGCRDRTHHGDPIGETGDNTAWNRLPNDKGRIGEVVRHRGLAAREGPHQRTLAHGLTLIVVNQVQLEEIVPAKPVVPLRAEALLAAVVVVVARAVVPEIGGLRVGLLEIALGVEKTEGVFAFEPVDRDGEIFDFAAKHGEFLLVGDVNELVRTAGLAHRHLLGEPRCNAPREAVTDAALFPH